MCFRYNGPLELIESKIRWKLFQIGPWHFFTEISVVNYLTQKVDNTCQSLVLKSQSVAFRGRSFWLKHKKSLFGLIRFRQPFNKIKLIHKSLCNIRILIVMWYLQIIYVLLVIVMCSVNSLFLISDVICLVCVVFS